MLVGIGSVRVEKTAMHSPVGHNLGSGADFIDGHCKAQLGATRSARYPQGGFRDFGVSAYSALMTIERPKVR